MMDFKAFQKPQEKKKVSIQDIKNKVLLYTRQNGPVLPIDVARATGKNTILVGAILSELISDKVVKITKCKIGGSPLYYVPGQETKLTRIRNYLSQKPRQIFDSLKERKIMKDSELEPWERVAIREIKDFAFPLQVTVGETAEIFWKWYMADDDETNRLISGMLNPKEERKEERIEERPGKEKPKEPELKEIKEKPKEKPGQEVKVEKKPEQARLVQEKKKIAKSPLRDKALEFFNNTAIEVMDELAGKRAECSFIVEFSSPIGKLKYLAIAKSKKKLTDDDVHIAHSMGVHEKLPVLLLAKDIGKKAEKTLNERGIIFKKL